MDSFKLQYKDKLIEILTIKADNQVKILLVQGLISSLKQIEQINKIHQLTKCKPNYQVLSTSISECPSNTSMFQKDIQELQEKIMKLRLVKFQNNEDIQTTEEQFQQMEKIVKTRSEYNDYLKKHVDSKMEVIQHNSGQKIQKQKDKSYLNKSLDTVAEILKISKWWK